MLTFKVTGMTCGHCVRAVSNALQAIDPNAQVQIELSIGEVRVQSDLPSEQLLAAIKEEGYEAQLLASV